MKYKNVFNIAMIIKIINIFIILLLVTFCIYAQENKISEAVKYYQNNKFYEAKSAIDSTVKHPETLFDARSWFFRGMINSEIYNQFEKSDAKSPAREEAINSFKKFIQLGAQNEMKIPMKDDVGNSVVTIISNANELCKKKIYYFATTYFNDVAIMMDEKKLSEFLSHINLCEQHKDTMNAKSIIYEGSKETLASVIADYEKYNEPIPDNYKKNKEDEIEKYKNVLDIAINTHTQCKSDLQAIANQYKNLLPIAIETYEKYKETMKVVDANKNFINEDTQFFILLASIYTNIYKSDDKNNKDYFTKAQNYYRFVLDIDPNNYSANLQLGVLFYNEAVEIAKSLNTETDIIAITMKENEMIEYFTKSLPYMQKAYVLNPSTLQPLLGLSSIYRGLYEYDKALVYSEKAYELDRTNKDILKELMWIYYYANQIEKGKTIQKELEKLDDK